MFIPISLVMRALCFCTVRQCHHLSYTDCADRICSCPSTSYFFFKSDSVSPVYYTTLSSLMLFPDQCLQMYSKGHPNLNFKSKYFKNFSSFEWQIYYNIHSKYVSWIKTVIMEESKKRRLYIWVSRNWLHIRIINHRLLRGAFYISYPSGFHVIRVAAQIIIK